MAKFCNCYVLNVGQGSATFVVVVDDTSGKDVPIATVLADLGSGSWNVGSKKYTLTIDMIEEVLNKMAGGARLDLLVLSHSDNDHINLMGMLLERFSPDGKKKPKLTIGKCVYGGWYAQYNKTKIGNILDTVATFMSGSGTFDKTATSAPAMSSGFAFSGSTVTETKLINVSGLSVTTLLMNAPRPSLGKGAFTPDIELNTRSAVIVATYTDSHGDWANFVITGDATGPTFYAAHMHVFGSINRLKKRMAGTFLVTVPHHGSARTATCYIPFVPRTTEPEWEAIDDFVGDCLAYTAVASAGNTSHRHPRWSLLNRYFRSTGAPLSNSYYADPNLPAGAGHLYTSYFDGTELDTALGTTANSARYGCFATVPAMFTTYYFYLNAYQQKAYPNPSGSTVKLPAGSTLDTKAPGLVYWKYSVDDSDKVTVTPIPFTLSGDDTLALAAFVGFHPVTLAATARKGLGARREIVAPATALLAKPAAALSAGRARVLP
jgi:hypothetical protein